MSRSLFDKIGEEETDRLIRESIAASVAASHAAGLPTFGLDGDVLVQTNPDGSKEKVMRMRHPTPRKLVAGGRKMNQTFG